MARQLMLSVLVFGCAVQAQPPATHPAFDAFEVATVKPTPPDFKGGRFIRMQSAQQLVVRNHTVKSLVGAAYNLSPQAISGGPAWIETEGYDIVAKTPGEIRPNLEEQMSMLRKLLADRFQLTFHRETKELAIYTLTIAKGGPKLTESGASDAAPEGPPPLIFVLSPLGVSLPGRNATMGELASVMQRAALDRPVLDKTGLAGRYDFTLEWMPDETQFGGQGPKENPESTRPDLFAALQRQLGLKLEAARGPVQVLVFDRVERPSDN